MKKIHTIYLILGILACINIAHGQNPAGNQPQQDTATIDMSAIAVEMDSGLTETPVALGIDTTGIDTASIAIDLDSTDEAQLLFRIIDPLLPDVVLEQLSDSVYQMVRVDDEIYGQITEITGDKQKVLFKLYDNYRWNETHPYTFDKVYEYILTEDLDIIVMVSHNAPAAYITYCSKVPLCNHLAYLVEFDTLGRYIIFEMESRDGKDVAMFNYTLDYVNEATGTYIYPLNDLKKAPKKSFWQSFGKVATSIAGSALVAALLMLLLLL